jgi:hypothetical protein
MSERCLETNFSPELEDYLERARAAKQAYMEAWERGENPPMWTALLPKDYLTLLKPEDGESQTPGSGPEPPETSAMNTPNDMPMPDPPKRVNPVELTGLNPYVSPFDGISKERLIALTEDVGKSIKAEEAERARIRSLVPKANEDFLINRLERPVKPPPKPE